MKKQKNILLTTLSPTKDRLDVGYFVCETATGAPSFTTGISVAEAGIKFLLSQCRIDEIIVLGNIQDARNISTEGIHLSDEMMGGFFDLNEIDDYHFLIYRIAEYMRQVDMELLDVGELVSSERKNELSHQLTDFKKKYANDINNNEFFLKLCTDKEMEAVFLSEVLDGCSLREAAWIRRHLFSRMDAFYKMHMLDDNRNVLIRFMPVPSEKVLSIDTIDSIVNQTLRDAGADVKLYMDIQGMGFIDGNTLISTFLLTNDRTGYHCEVSGLIDSQRNPDGFAGNVSNMLKNFTIRQMISGLDIFLMYGKVDLLASCWDSLEFDDPDADRLFYGMKCIDEGVALCNVDLIACGINIIRKTLLHQRNDSDNRNIFLNVIINAIKADFGAMLYGDDLSIPELLKWCLRKGLYQQLLTIIESRVPQDMVKRGIYYYAEKPSDIQNLMVDWNLLFWNESAKMRWAFNDIEHYFIKSYGRSYLNFGQNLDMVAKDYARMRIDALHGRDEHILPAYSQLNNDDLLYELLLGYYRIGNLRNLVNHAIIDEPDIDLDELTERTDSRNMLKIELKKFIGIYNTACKQTIKTKEPLLLPSGKMKAYSRRHRIQPLEENINLATTNSYSCSFNGKEVMIRIAMFRPEDIEDDWEETDED